MHRFALLVILALPAVVDAQTTNVGTLQLSLRKCTRQDDGTCQFNNSFSETELREFFGRASCCDDEPFGVRFELVGAPADVGNLTVEMWVGTDCDDVTNLELRNRRCEHLADLDTKLDEFRQSVTTLPFPAQAVMAPNQGSCPSREGTNTVFALVDADADGDFTGTDDHVWKLNPAISFDLEPPPAVASPEIVGVEDGIVVKWEDPSTQTDIESIQVLCATEDGQPVLDNPPDPEYRVSVNACPVTGSDAGPDESDAGTSDAGAGKPDLAMFDALDPAFVCSGRVGRGTNSTRIALPRRDPDAGPGPAIVAKVVSVDVARNFTAVDVPGSATPAPVSDAWEVYEEAGGQAEGGFCFVATAVYGNYDHPFVRVLRAFRDDTLARFGAGRAFIAWYYAHSPPWADWLRAHSGARVVAQVLLVPVVALAWLWNVFGLWLVVVPALLWLARRRRLKLAAALSILLFGRDASAQVFLDEAGYAEERPVPLSQFVVELKVGLYHPDVDGEPGLPRPGPYERVFGDNKIILPQIELDWLPFHFLGQLGLAASIGYTQETDKAFSTNPDGTPNFDQRSEDSTGFHLLPMSLSVVYRFTELADRTYVPIVPYAKLGLSYYVWWINKGNGGFANTPAGGRALGGTLGWQGSIGVSIRVDAVDPEASKNLSADMGIEHVGIFFEGTYANVSGLWQDNRLHVGDLFWSAGVNFEF